MTVSELCRRMDSRELSEWMAIHRYYHAIPDEWEQTGLIVSSLLAPYSRDTVPKPADFVPTQTPPRHPEQDIAALRQLARELNSDV